jgi:hypothetical protein
MAGVKTIGLTGITVAMNDRVDKFAEKELRSRSLKALADVKLMTPVDTGAARNSWYIGYKEQYFDNSKGENNPTSNIQVLVPRNKPGEIFVTNGVTYIQLLNEGSSKQAPMKFIESAFSKYFKNVKVEYVNK